MTPTRIKGKAIYQPAGAAEEYSKWACNLYKGCDHNCVYCYCKRGILAHALGGPHAVLKETLGNEQKAFDIFRKEMVLWRTQIIEDGGLFFSFSSDPFLSHTTDLNVRCILYALGAGVPVQILTKATEWVYCNWIVGSLYQFRDLLKIGFTLTGHDEQEPSAPSTTARIAAMLRLSDRQFYTFASIEPVIDFAASLGCILKIAPLCKELRIGLLSPYSTRRYDWQQCDRFIDKVTDIANHEGITVRWKDSINRFYRDAMPAYIKEKAIVEGRIK